MPTTGPESPPELATARLVLRPLAEADLDTVVTLAGDGRVAEWTTRIPHPLTREGVAVWHGTHNRLGRGPGEHVFALRRKDDGALVGVAGLVVADDEKAAGIGYWVGVPFWNRGYATEAVRRLTVHGFGALGLSRIEADVFAGNARSARVLERAGFEARGHTRRESQARGGTVDAVIYRMERADFARVALSQAVGRE